MLACSSLRAPPRPSRPATIKMPPQLTDPTTADKLASAMEALTKALLDLPVGEVQAAVEGREPPRPSAS